MEFACGICFTVLRQCRYMTSSALALLHAYFQINVHLQNRLLPQLPSYFLIFPGKDKSACRCIISFPFIWVWLWTRSAHVRTCVLAVAIPPRMSSSTAAQIFVLLTPYHIFASSGQPRVTWTAFKGGVCESVFRIGFPNHCTYCWSQGRREWTVEVSGLWTACGGRKSTGL